MLSWSLFLTWRKKLMIFVNYWTGCWLNGLLPHIKIFYVNIIDPWTVGGFRGADPPCSWKYTHLIYSWSSTSRSLYIWGSSMYIQPTMDHIVLWYFTIKNKKKKNPTYKRICVARMHVVQGSTVPQHLWKMNFRCISWIYWEQYYKPNNKITYTNHLFLFEEILYSLKTINSMHHEKALPSHALFSFLC